MDPIEQINEVIQSIYLTETIKYDLNDGQPTPDTQPLQTDNED